MLDRPVSIFVQPDQAVQVKSIFRVSAFCVYKTTQQQSVTSQTHSTAITQVSYLLQCASGAVPSHAANPACHRVCSFYVKVSFYINVYMYVYFLCHNVRLVPPCKFYFTLFSIESPTMSE